MISSAVASGRAHIASTSGEKPQGNAGALGWRKTGGEYADWRPQGDRIGWVDGENLYLEPEASYRVAQTQAQGGEALTVGARTLRKRIKERGYLVSIDEKRQTLTVRRTVEGVKDRGVLHLRLSSLFSDGDEPDEPDDEGEEPDKNGGSGPSPSSGSVVDPPRPDAITDEVSGSEGARWVSERAPDGGEPFGDAESEDERRVRRVVEGGEARPEDGGVADEPFSFENLDAYEMVTTSYGLNEEDRRGAAQPVRRTPPKEKAERCGVTRGSPFRSKLTTSRTAFLPLRRWHSRQASRPLTYALPNTNGPTRKANRGGVTLEIRLFAWKKYREQRDGASIDFAVWPAHLRSVGRTRR